MQRIVWTMSIYLFGELWRVELHFAQLRDDLLSSDTFPHCLEYLFMSTSRQHPKHSIQTSMLIIHLHSTLFIRKCDIDFPNFELDSALWHFRRSRSNSGTKMRQRQQHFGRILHSVASTLLPSSMMISSCVQLEWPETFCGEAGQEFHSFWQKT